MTRHSKPNKEKLQVAEDFTKLLNEYPIIAAVNVQSLPAKQLQTMREKLRGKCAIRMAKRRVMLKAMDKAKHKGLDQLKPHLKGMPALLFTKENPFTLFKTVKQNKSKAPAKGGQVAPFDIIVPAGPTTFAPGPIIGELGSFGIKTGVEGGKIAVKQDSVAAKEGAVISPKLAGLLLRLGIEPMEIGLDITAVYENGSILTRSVLDVDETQYRADIALAAAQALELGIQIGFLDAETRAIAVQRAVRGAINVAHTANVTDLVLSEAEQAVLTALTAAPVAAAAAAPVAAAAPAKEEKNEEAAAEGLGSLFG